MGGYYNNAEDTGKDLLIRERNYTDNAVPSANGVAIANLVRLALLTDNLNYFDKARQALSTFATVFDRSPQACPSLFTALDWFIYGNSVKTTSQQLSSLLSRYLPTTVVSIVTDLPDDSVGILCRVFSCLEPAQSLEQLLVQIEEINRTQ